MFMIDVMILAAPGRFSSFSNTTGEPGSSCLTGLHRCSHPMDNDGRSQNRPRGFNMPSTRPVMVLGSFLDALDFVVGSTKSPVSNLPRQTNGQNLRGGCAGGHCHPRPDAITRRVRRTGSTPFHTKATAPPARRGKGLVRLKRGSLRECAKTSSGFVSRRRIEPCP